MEENTKIEQSLTLDEEQLQAVTGATGGTGGGKLSSVLKNILKCFSCEPHHPTPPKSSRKQLRWVDPSGDTRVSRSDSILTPIPEEEHSNHSHPIE